MALTRTQTVDVDFRATWVERLRVKFVAVGSHGQGRSNVLFLRVGTSHVEDNLVSRASVSDIKILDFDSGVRHAQVETTGAQGVGGQSRHNTQAQQGPDEGPHIESGLVLG